MTRLLAVHPYPDLYGSDLMLLRSLQAARQAGCEVRLLVPESGPLLERVSEAGIAYRIVPFPVLRKSMSAPAAAARLAVSAPKDTSALISVIRDYRPDVLYVNTLTLPHWLAAARLARVPAVCHVRELETELHPAMDLALTAPLTLATVVLANSKATAAHLRARWPMVAPRTHVIYNGYEFPPEPRSAPRSRRIVVVGRLSPRKGQDVAIRALAALLELGHDVSLELVGSAFQGYEWFVDALRGLARSLGVLDRLVLSGYRSPVWDHYARAAVTVVPSRLEPFGGVAVEALAVGSPVVVSDVGGLPEIVRHGVTGLVVPPDDPVALTQGLHRLLEDPYLAEAMGRRGAADVRQRFDQNRYHEELLDRMEQVKASQDGSRSAREAPGSPRWHRPGEPPRRSTTQARRH